MSFASFYPVVDSSERIAQLVSLGVQIVQLRIKEKDETFIRSELHRAKNLCAGTGAQLVVNDYWQLAIDVGCQFVHLGQEDMDDADLEALRRRGIRVGISSHSLEELDRAQSANPAYVALGPIFPTLLKKMPWAPQGLERVRQWKALLGPTPLVAIGGLTPSRAREVLQAGADSAAVVTDLVRAKDFGQRAREWLQACRTGPGLP